MIQSRDTDSVDISPRKAARGPRLVPALVLCGPLVLSASVQASRAYLPQAQDPASTAYRPRVLKVAGEGSFLVQRMVWSSWSPRIARGRGVGAQDDCEPDYATGTFHRARARTRLLRAVWGLGEFPCE
jgi:hypothetical protein